MISDLRRLVYTPFTIYYSLMIGRPKPDEAASYYSIYIDRVTSDDVVGFLTQQQDEAVAFLKEISEEQSLHRYAADKWSMRELLGHVNDCERVFAYRALWFARAFPDPLPSFDQEIAVAGADSDKVSWANLIDEFQSVRASTIALFRQLPEEAWSRTGIASDNPVSVRALAYIMAGHVSHHLAILRERYV
ncbi:MAG TPA: DinB family protein [Pyrinomonadaceae bacterium]|nr:DinB family protein [Pyrinomonadaceae bacterium]